MKKYSLNKKNLSELSNFLGVPFMKIYQDIKLSTTTGHERFKNDNLTCSDIVNICNAYHIPTKCFVKVDGKECKLEVKDDWKEIVPKFYLFSDSVQINQTLISVIEKLGISTATWFRHTDPPIEFAQKTTLKDYLKWCDTLNLNADSYIGDTNGKIPEVQEYEDGPNISQVLTRYRKLTKENEKLKWENDRFKQVFNALRSLVNLFDSNPKHFHGEVIVARKILKMTEESAEFPTLKAAEEE